MDGDKVGAGSVSEWSEGNLKSLRLHEAQELINIGKMDKLKMIGGEWGWQIWLSGIDLLYGEGISKYKDKEIGEVEELKGIIRGSLKINPPFVTTVSHSIGGKKNLQVMNADNWEIIRRLGEIYERKIKQLNDLHGLSTRNTANAGYF